MLKRKGLVLFIIAVLLCSFAGSVFAAEPAAVKNPRIQVLPIHNAKFLVGQRFDLKVEAFDISEPVMMSEIKINGVNAETYFGVKPEIDAKTQLPVFRGVAMPQAGTFTVFAEIMTRNLRVYDVTYSWTVVAPEKIQAKNVILLVADGMSLPIRTAARILSKGLTEGKYNGLLEMDEMDVMATITTSGSDSLVTDSANSASAYATGHKSAVNAMGVYADSTADPFDDPKVETIIELLKRTRGMSTGIVSDANITDATPAAFVAHTRRRSEQNVIAEQMLKVQPDVILGGGARQFLPKSTNGSRRTDDRNLIEEAKAAGYTFADSGAAMQAARDSKKLLGLFNLDNMNVWLDRHYYKNPDVLKGFNDQPDVDAMTEVAINILSKNPSGFFLMVEGGHVDKQAHAMDFERTVYDAIQFDKAVGVAKRFAEKNNDTLVIVVADHSHSMSITGTYHELDGKKGRDAVRTYAAAGFPTYTDADGDGYPDDPNASIRVNVGWANHPDYMEDFQVNPTPQGPAISGKDGKTIPNPQRGQGGVFMTGNLPNGDTSEVHTADDVPLTASGPGARYFKPVMDNTEVFYAMVEALGLNPVKELK